MASTPHTTTPTNNSVGSEKTCGVHHTIITTLPGATAAGAPLHTHTPHINSPTSKRCKKETGTHNTSGTEKWYTVKASVTEMAPIVPALTAGGTAVGTPPLKSVSTSTHWTSGT